jgi:peptide/nickel transport system substrate-binding protein
LPQHLVGGEVIIASDSEPQTLNAFMAVGDIRGVTLIGQTYAAGVFDIDADTQTFIPELVTELPTTANGGVVLNADGTMTVKYIIRDEAQWEDGTPVSGDDFTFTLDTIMNPDYPIDKENYEDIVASEAGPKTFEYTMASPTLRYESMFGEIIPKHSVEGSDFVVDWNDTRWASAGPFILEDWVKGESLTLRRNPNYWKIDAETEQNLPYLDSVTFRFMEDTPSMIDAFQNRAVDVFSPARTDDRIVEYIRTLQDLEPEGAFVDVLDGPEWEHLNFQFGPGRFNRNENSCSEIYEMRLAIAQTVDREALTDDVLAGTVEPLLSYVDPFSPTLSTEAWAQYSFDPVEAAANYAEAVRIAGRECSVVFTTNTGNEERVRVSELLVGMFEASGIPYQNKLEDSVDFFGETLSTGSWDLGQWTWRGSPGLSSIVGFHDVFDPEPPPPPDDQNFYRWGTEDSSVIDDTTRRFAEVRDGMNATVDEHELAALIREAESILADDLVIIPLYAHPVAGAVWEDEIVGFKHNPTQAGFTWNIESWWRNDL